jgi:hypothetical protein
MSPIGDLANSTLTEVKCRVPGAILYFYGEPLVLVLKRKFRMLLIPHINETNNLVSGLVLQKNK